MNQPQMTNEQIALRIASEKFSIPSDVIMIADRYYRINMATNISNY